MMLRDVDATIQGAWPGVGKQNATTKQYGTGPSAGQVVYGYS